jgi:hypothetical protein
LSTGKIIPRVYTPVQIPAHAVSVADDFAAGDGGVVDAPGTPVKCVSSVRDGEGDFGRFEEAVAVDRVVLGGHAAGRVGAAGEAVCLGERLAVVDVVS